MYRSPRAYKIQGTPEYILAKAGLVEINLDALAPAGQVQGTAALHDLFDSGAPVYENIEHHLVALVNAEAADRSGSLSGTPDRSEAFQALVAQGLREDATGSLYALIQQGMDRVAQEKARRGPAMR